MMRMGTSKLRSLFLAAALACGAPAAAQVHVGQAVAVDGDSLEIGDVRFRLFGVDALEARQTCNRRDQIWGCGQEAAAVLRGMLENKTVTCDQRDIDAYGRIVAVCTANGRDLAQEMVRMGLAVALPEFTTDYVEWEDLARQRGLGIWSAEFERPSEFRAGDDQSVREERALLAEARRREAARQGQARQTRGRASMVYYRNCAEARAAGAAPIYRGQPGYRQEMDGDGDGIACEPYHGRR
jgi:endonuclease YncB( thermonuclease family)